MFTINELKQLFGFSDDVEKIHIIDGYLVTETMKDTEEDIVTCCVHRLKGFKEQIKIDYGLSTDPASAQYRIETEKLGEYHGNIHKVRNALRLADIHNDVRPLLNRKKKPVAED